ncbi:MAG: tRNA dihydrouridine synthase DusB [Desulfobacterales bacterium]|nr:tRNA dihydrouridine synthase DusB [Desulfobacterales bacterium]
MKIGSINLENITILAPLAGITNLPFRIIVKQAGCALVCSEMVSANGLVYKSGKTEQFLDSTPEEKPLSVQIFGSDPSIMAEAAKIVESSGADILDINFGCSVRKILKSGSGAALMKDTAKAEAVLKAVRKSVTIPLTIKIRTGWDKSGTQALEISEIAEKCGVDAITVHPRTGTQGFRGVADWSVIGAVKKHVSIPVIGNGDIVIPEDAVKMQNQTNCDAIMIGRAAMGNPWIFSQVLALIRGEPVPPVDILQRFEIMKRYLRASVKYFGEKNACYMMRSRLGWFAKGLPHSSRFRESIKQVLTENEAAKLIEVYEKSVYVNYPALKGGA